MSDSLSDLDFVLEEIENDILTKREVDKGGLPIFKVRVNYKSQAFEEFWVSELSVNNGTWSWKSITDQNKPIKLGVDEIESVWQVAYVVIPKDKLIELGLK